MQDCQKTRFLIKIYAYANWMTIFFLNPDLLEYGAVKF